MPKPSGTRVVSREAAGSVRRSPGTSTSGARPEAFAALTVLFGVSGGSSTSNARAIGARSSGIAWAVAGGLLVLLLSGRSCDDSCAKPGTASFLWKTYKREGLLPVGSRFLHAKVCGAEVCAEMAEMYNSKPSVVAADMVLFTCETVDR